MVVLAHRAKCRLLRRVFSVLFLFRFGQVLLLLGLLLLLGRLRRKILVEISDAQLSPIASTLPVEGDVLYGAVLAIGTIDRAEHKCAIFYRTAEGPKLVHGPGERHRARAWHTAEGWSQACGAAAR